MNGVHKAAKTYLDAGLSVIPLGPKSKIPVLPWAEFQARRPDAGELNEWFGGQPDANVGIVCGDVSNRLLVLDFDDLQGYKDWAKEHPDLNRTKRVRTDRGGVHLYFHLGDGDGSLTTQPFLWKGKHIGEIRFNGGQVVAPPSKGNGNGWRWLTGKDVPIKTIPTWAVLGLELKKEAASTPAEAGAIVGNYAKAAVARQVGELILTDEGERNTKLNAAAYSLGRFIGAGELGRDYVEAELSKAALRIGLEEKEIEATIRSGIVAGIQEPRVAPLPRRKEKAVEEKRKPVAFLSEY